MKVAGKAAAEKVAAEKAAAERAASDAKVVILENARLCVGVRNTSRIIV